MRTIIILCVLWLAGVEATTGKDHRVIKMVALNGRVIDEGSDSPVVTTLTILGKNFNMLEITTDTNGGFSTSIPESEECNIVIRANGFEPQANVISLIANRSNYVEIRLMPIVKCLFIGELTNSKDKAPIQGELKVFRNSDFSEEDEKEIHDGKFSEPLTNFGFYIVDFSAKGYVEATDTVWVLNCHRRTLHRAFELKPIEKGLTLALKNIYFNFGKTSLNSDSYAELDPVATFLISNPTLQVEIAGHTDSDGPDDYNLFLSQGRAQEVVNYLKSRGVAAAQLMPKGYGESKPIDSNATLAGKANNRRVEMVVLKE